MRYQVHVAYLRRRKRSPCRIGRCSGLLLLPQRLRQEGVHSHPQQRRLGRGLRSTGLHAKPGAVMSSGIMCTADGSSNKRSQSQQIRIQGIARSSVHAAQAHECAVGAGLGTRQYLAHREGRAPRAQLARRRARPGQARARARPAACAARPAQPPPCAWPRRRPRAACARPCRAQGTPAWTRTCDSTACTVSSRSQHLYPYVAGPPPAVRPA
jgi:hypothetical protein